MLRSSLVPTTPFLPIEFSVDPGLRPAGRYPGRARRGSRPTATTCPTSRTSRSIRPPSPTTTAGRRSSSSGTGSAPRPTAPGARRRRRCWTASPGLTTAFFSILSPRKHIGEHRGPWRGVLRYHLALRVPEPPAAAGISVGGQVAHWEEGRSLLFDDGYEHHAWNDTDGVRVVLFVDVIRPLQPAGRPAQPGPDRGHRPLAVHPGRPQPPRGLGAPVRALRAGARHGSDLGTAT